IHSDQYGQAFASFLTEHAKAKLGMEPKAVKVALIHEDGPYGVGVAAADEAYCQAAGIQVVLKQGYSASAPDLSVLVTKIKRAGADVISHAGYNPDITLLLRQARESGLRFKMLVGNGAGYSQLDKIRATFGPDVDNFCNIDPVPAQLLKPETLAPGLGDLVKVMVERYKAKTNATDVPPHCSMGFNQTWVLLTNVLPVAKEKYGSFDPEAVRKAALDVDIAPGGTIQGYGVKFYPPGSEMSGQNERSTPVVMQYAGEHISVVWPGNIKTQDAVMPLPKSSAYAKAGACVDDSAVDALTMLAVEGLSKRFGGFLAVNQVSFVARQGEILGLIGPNGSGKSTTFNLIAGTLKPSAGSIRFEGAEIAGHS